MRADIEAKIVRNKSTKKVVIFLTTRSQKDIKCDQRTEFKNRLISLTYKYSQAKLSFSTPYHPEAKGKAERTNQTFVIKMAKRLQNNLIL